MIDSSKALRRTIRDAFGQRSPVQRYIRHRERNVLEPCPSASGPQVKRRLRRARASDDHAVGLVELRTLAGKLERSHLRRSRVAAGG